MSDFENSSCDYDNYMRNIHKPPFLPLLNPPSHRDKCLKTFSLSYRSRSEWSSHHAPRLEDSVAVAEARNGLLLLALNRTPAHPTSLRQMTSAARVMSRPKSCKPARRRQTCRIVVSVSSYITMRHCKFDLHDAVGLFQLLERFGSLTLCEAASLTSSDLLVDGRYHIIYVGGIILEKFSAEQLS
jgi:hypothetical protein